MSAQTAEYRIARPVRVRLVGAYLVLLALVLLVLTLVVALAGWSPDPIVLVLGVGVLGLIALAWWLRSRLVVVRLAPAGYRLRLIRVAGLAEGRWSEVDGVLATSVGGVDCVVIQMKDGRATTIPMSLVEVDKDAFAADVRRHLEAAHR